jgi:hypothetical protein
MRMSVLRWENGDVTRKKFPLEVMLRAMREVDNGVPVSVVCRKVAFYRYREKYQVWSRRRPGGFANSSKKLQAQEEQGGCRVVRTAPTWAEEPSHFC